MVSLRLLTYRPDLLDMRDVRTTIFHFFIIRKCILREKIIIPEDGVGSGMGLRLSESHGGKELANAAITELALIGSGLIESVSNGFDRKNAIFYLRF